MQKKKKRKERIGKYDLRLVLERKKKATLQHKFFKPIFHLFNLNLNCFGECEGDMSS